METDEQRLAKTKEYVTTLLDKERYRKWNARYISKLKKDLKRLKDKGIKHGKLCSENKDEHIFACLLDSLTHAICISHECRMIKKSRKNSGK